MVSSPPRRRLDLRLVESQLAPTRERAQSLIAAGLVEVDGARAVSAAQPVGESSALRVLGRDHPYASRAGAKLAGGLDHFMVDPAGRVALDAGASTGGFTDVLLARGAERVYAVDVGRGQLDSRLAGDNRVVVLDRTNLRHLEQLPGPPPSLVTLDLSFISLRLVLERVCALAAPGTDVVALFKPQFELGRDAIGKGGVVTDQERARAGADALLAWAVERFGCIAQPPVPAAVRGTKGNQEWMLHLRLRGAP
ncbi:MAG: TlyA family RNA methyltransferase [Candidatus Dormibacteria bacterium]